MGLIKKSLTPLISLVVLAYIIYQIEPPKSWEEATLTHWVLFYLPLLVLLTFISNLFIKYPPKSLVLGLGVTLLVILQGLDSLTIITGPFVIIGTILILRSLKTSVNLPKHSRSPRLIKLRRQ